MATLCAGSGPFRLHSTGRSAGRTQVVFVQQDGTVAGRRGVFTVENVGIEVDAVGPGDRAGDGVHGNLCEHGSISERLEDTTFEDAVEVELAHQAVGEGEAQPEVTQVFDIYDSRRSAHRRTLSKGLDRDERCRSLRPLPVVRQVRPMQLGPLPHEASRSTRKGAGEERGVRDPHERLVAAVDRVEVGRLVILPVHVHDDPVELAEPRHAAKGTARL